MGEWSKYIIEIGFGTEHLGEDPNIAVLRAVEFAMNGVCIPGLYEMFDYDPEKIKKNTRVEVLVGTPYPEKVDVERVKKAIPLDCEKVVKIVEGGLLGEGVVSEEHNIKRNIIVSNAFITVYVRK